MASVYESAEQELSVNELGLNDRAADIWKPLFALAQVLNLEKGIVDSLKRLATDMGGDAETVEDERKLEIVLALRCRAQEGPLHATTEDLMKVLDEFGCETAGINLHAVLFGWGFRQKAIRLKNHSGQPRRAWELMDNRLAALETELETCEHPTTLKM